MVNTEDYKNGNIYRITDHYRALELESLKREGFEEDIKKHNRYKADKLIEAKMREAEEYASYINNLMRLAYADLSICTGDADADIEAEEKKEWAIKMLKVKFDIEVI